MFFVLLFGSPAIDKVLLVLAAHLLLEHRHRSDAGLIAVSQQSRIHLGRDVDADLAPTANACSALVQKRDKEVL